MDNSEAVTLGPLSFTPQQVFVSLASSLISLPVSILIVFLFRKAGHKPVKPKRNVETGAIEYVRYHYAKITSFRRYPSSVTTITSSAEVNDLTFPMFVQFLQKHAQYSGKQNSLIHKGLRELERF